MADKGLTKCQFLIKCQFHFLSHVNDTWPGRCIQIIFLIFSLMSLKCLFKYLCPEAVVRKVFCEKGVLENFPKFTGKHLRQSHYFNKFGGLWPTTLLKKRLWYRCFPVNFAKFLRTTFLQNTSGGCFCVSKGASVFLRSNSFRTVQFLLTNLQGHYFNTLIQTYVSKKKKKTEDRFITLVFKIKQLEAIQLP